MATKSFTLSSVRIINKSSIFRIFNIMLIRRTNFFISFYIRINCLDIKAFSTDDQIKQIQIKVIAIMKKYNESVKINQNPIWLYIPDHPFGILIFAGAGLGKTNVLLNLMKNQQPDYDKIYLEAKDPFESKYNCILTEGKKLDLRI